MDGEFLLISLVVAVSCICCFGLGYSVGRADNDGYNDDDGGNWW
jgi:hypothetical protein